MQLVVFVDGIIRSKVLMIFKGSITKRNSACRLEYKAYHKNVIVIFNNKAYANTFNLID
jgi:hypothetical protein